MLADAKKRYHFSSWGSGAKQEASVLLLGFHPWAKDFPGWTRTIKERIVEADRKLWRTVWDNPKDPAARVLVDVWETASRAQARQCLLETLAANQLARLPEGPSDLGEAAFVHPEGLPAAVFWAAGNLCLSVHSIATTAVPILDWARRLNGRIMERPQALKAGLELTARAARLKVAEETALDISMPKTPSEEGYQQVFAEGGELFWRDDAVYVKALRKGDLLIEAFVAEPRKTLSGRLVLSVKG